MIASKPTPSGSWSFVVTALAELGRTEIERRQRAAEIRAGMPVEKDQIDNGRDSANTMIAATEAAE